MGQWAILCGIEGNLTAYEAVLADLHRQRHPVTDLYILGDVVGLKGNSQAVIQRLQFPSAQELQPQVCLGWWEEQYLSLHGWGAFPDTCELVAQAGVEAVRQLWEAVPRESVAWLRSLHFGFHELDCLLIHGSTVGCTDQLTPTTPATQLYDRLVRADANNLFCGRSGLAFEYWVKPSGLRSTVTTLNGNEAPQEQEQFSRRVIGVGNVGRKTGEATYILYNPATNEVTFKALTYGHAKGFGKRKGF